MKKVADYLAELGFTITEIKIYQGLLQTGQVSITDLAKYLGINRVTLHFNIENLIRKGIVTQTVKGARRQIVAEPPERLHYFVEQKLDQAKTLDKKFPDILKTINCVYSINKTKQDIKIKYYEGKENVGLLYDEVRKMTEVHSFVNLDRYYKVFPNTEELFKKALDNNPKRHVWVITPDTNFAHYIEDDEKEKYPRYFCKYIPKSKMTLIFNFANLAEYLIYDDKLAIVQLSEEIATATVVYSRLIYLSFRALHQYIWELIS